MIFMSDELRNQSFSKQMRGYSVEEVEDYIDRVLECYDNLASEYTKLENGFREFAARAGSLEQKEKEAEKILADAHDQAEKLLGEVRGRAADSAQKVLDAARAQAEQMAQDAESLVRSQKRTYNELKAQNEQFRAEIVKLCSEYIRTASATLPDAILEAALHEVRPEEQPSAARRPAEDFSAGEGKSAATGEEPEKKADDRIEAGTEPEMEFGVDWLKDNRKMPKTQKASNPFDVSFLRPENEGEEQLKVKKTSLHGGISRTAAEGGANIADLADSLKAESKKSALDAAAKNSAGTKERQSYSDVMQALGKPQGAPEKHNPLKFIP